MSHNPRVFFPHHTSISKSLDATLINVRKDAFSYQFFTEGVSKFRKPEDEVRIWELPEKEVFDKSLEFRGMIFHPSHCGSTLLSRMLDALPKTRILCEPESINSLLLAYLYYDLPRTEVINRLRAIMERFRQRLDDEEHLIFKSTSWNVFLIDLFLEAYPDVPWIYLDRDTEKAVDSSLRDGGGWVSWWNYPTDLPRKFFVNNANPPVDQESYVRNVILGQRERAHQFANEQSRFFHYPEFIDQLETDILPHFGLNFSKEEIDEAKKMKLYKSKSFELELFDKELTG